MGLPPAGTPHHGRRHVYSEVFCNFGGRHTQHQVTITIGEVHEEYQRAGDVVRASYDAGLQALRPGRTFGEVVEAMHEPIEKPSCPRPSMLSESWNRLETPSSVCAAFSVVEG